MNYGMERKRMSEKEDKKGLESPYEEVCETNFLDYVRHLFQEQGFTVEKVVIDGSENDLETNTVLIHLYVTLRAWGYVESVFFFLKKNASLEKSA